MIANERYLKILNLLNSKGSITINEIVDLLNISESTVRRDLNTLDKEKKLIKVHGGAISNKSIYVTQEESLNHKKFINQDEKKEIAKKASTLIKPNDFVYIDSGTTTYEMTNFITEKSATYVTNSIPIAQNMIEKNFNVFILGGKIKPNTQAIVGSFAKECIKNFNFTIGFFGTNGISLKNSYTTPDIEEADIKKIAINKSNKVFVLCDSSKFNLVSSITFANIEDACIITNKFDDVSFLKSFKDKTKILEV
ncbi:DeoR/GlpR family DNA-binding transcription regulator [[Clostridium] colinum]|uniref:DeoR/GlpR family DNA-binding transcription regulator n=1 Tax=[Clostridium] colinum TaxID=36835 RepID=UPI00202482B0|nr:DeoR/GlpR family DNA-binding transcription regulator [[Clostridium] colinum]